MKTLKRLVYTVDFRHITFTGGEPFLADGLAEMVLFCRMKNKGVTIVSNGAAAEAEDYRILVDLGVSLFEFPLLADRGQIHDDLTGRPGTFDRVLRSIRTIARSNSRVCAVCVLTKPNIGRLPHTLRLANDNGVEKCMLARFNLGGRGIAHTNELLPSVTELSKAFSTADAFAATGSMGISSNVCVPFCVINPRDYPNISIAGCGADPLRRPVTVDFSGAVRVCNHSPHVIGNIHSTPIDSMLSSDYVQTWQAARPVYCLDCDDWHECRGGCRAASEQMGKTLRDADPIIAMLAG
jgi:radical SAM protein with 4Fe4S-binding SPASM domain